MVHLKMTVRRALKLAHGVRHVTLGEAAQLPNLLGRITPAMLRAHEYYAVRIGDQRVLFVLRDEKYVRISSPL
jgi:hypothetical protein